MQFRLCVGMGYDMNIMWRSVCLFVDPVEICGSVFLFGCSAAGQTSG